MGTITGRYHCNPLKTARGVAKTRLTVEQEDHSGPVSLPCDTIANSVHGQYWHSETVQHENVLGGRLIHVVVSKKSTLPRKNRNLYLK